MARHGVSNRQLSFWFVLLFLAQMADVATTAMGLTRGAVEGNWIAASLLDRGGLTLFWGTKLLIALLMGATVLMVMRYARLYPGRRALVLNRVLWVGLQLGVFVLTLAALNNLAVFAVSS
jgi:hypothetical protein